MSRGRPSEEERFAKNPFRQTVVTNTIRGTRAIYASPTKENEFAMVSKITGEIYGDITFGKRIEVDKTQFLKLYANGVKMFLGLSSAGIKVFMLIYDLLMEKVNYQEDYVDLVYNMLEDYQRQGLGRTTFFRGIKELKQVGFLAPAIQEGKYWINTDYMFRGDRLTLVNQYIMQPYTKKEQEALQRQMKLEQVKLQNESDTRANTTSTADKSI